MNTKMSDTAKMFEEMFINSAKAKAEEARKSFALMLPNCLSAGTWITEGRYATKAELDAAVEVFSTEFKDDCDGYAPIVGKDFLACEIFAYDIADDENPDLDAYLDTIGEQKREELAL